MITEFKIFEDLNQVEPEIGDYVIINSDYEIFYKDELGIIEDIDNDDINNPIYYIHYPNRKDRWRPCGILDIEYWSKDKKEIEQLLMNKKFNI